MAQSIVGGLFGTDVQDILAKRQAQQEAQAMQVAQMDPLQQAQYGMARFGQNLANVAAPLFGVEDPQLKAAGIAQQLAGQFDMSTAAGLRDFSNALRQAGMETGNSQLANFAMMALDKSRALEVNQAELALKSAKTKAELAKAEKDLRELPGGIQKLIGNSTPASVEQFMKTGKISDLVRDRKAGGSISLPGFGEDRYGADKAAAIELLKIYGYKPGERIKPSDAARYPELLKAQATANRPTVTREGGRRTISIDMPGGEAD